MRIAIFTDTYTPQINGVVTSIKLFCAELERRGHEVHIFAPSGSGENVHTFPSVELSSYKGYRIGLPLTKDFLFHFNDFGFDVVHAQTPATAGIAALSMAKYHKIPIVATFHTLLPDYIHYIGGNFFKKIGIEETAKHVLWRYCKWFYNSCDATISPSCHTGAVLRRRGIKRIHIVPNGIDVSRIASKKKSFGTRNRTMLHVGRVTKEKNIERIVDALAAMPADVRLVITSEGPHLDELKSYAESKGVRDRIEFTGFLSASKLDDAYAKSGVFVMASKSEVHPLVLIEAAARKIPIVVLDSPATSEFVKENACGLVASEKRFEATVLKVLNDRDLAKGIVKHSNAVSEKYDISACAQKLIDVYTEVLNVKARD